MSSSIRTARRAGGCWRAASVSYGKATPYFPVIDLLKRYAQVDEHDDTRTIRAKVTGQVLTLDEALQDTIPALLSLLEALPEDSPFLHLEPPQRRQRTLEALQRLLLRESQVQPLLLVFEDLHWIDSETQALLDRLVERLPTAHLLLLVNYRPEYQHGWGSKTYYTQLRLDPLPPASAAEVLQALLGDDPSLAPLTQLLIARTEGNPFFLEESVRTLVETQVLVGEPGAYRLAQALPTIQIPATVQAVLAARIDRLPPEEKRLLQTAAVIGTEVPLPLLQAIAELPEADLHRGLAHLQAAEFLYETRLFPEREYTFKHALTHEVAYGSLLQERRRVLHARIVEALEQLAADRLAEQVERLAQHALRGEVWDKAVTYGQQAGAKAATARRSAPRRRTTNRPWKRSGTSLRLPTPGGWPSNSASAWQEAPCTHWASMGGSSPCSGRLKPWPGRTTIGPGSRGCWPGWPMCSGEGGLRRRPRGGPAGPRPRHRARRPRPAGGSVLSLGRLYEAIGDYGRAAELFRRNVEARDSGTGRQDGQIHALAWLARALSELGQFTEGRRHGEEALRLATVEGRGTEPMFAHLEPRPSVPGPRGPGGRDPPAGPGPGPLSRRRQLGLANGDHGGPRLCVCARGPPRRGARAAGGGDHAKVAARARGKIPARSHGSARSVSSRDTSRRPCSTRARRSTWPGSTGSAGSRRSRSASWAPSTPRPTRRRWPRAKHGTGRRWRWPRRSACARSRPTATIGLGTLYAKSGQREQARAELSTAIDLYRAMEMTFWLPQAEAMLAAVEGR